jgi:hypothetical protein
MNPGGMHLPAIFFYHKARNLSGQRKSLSGKYPSCRKRAIRAVSRQRIRIEETAWTEIVASAGGVPGYRDAPVTEGDRTGIGGQFAFPYSRR